MRYKKLIEETRLKVSQTLASNVTALYWKIGKRIQEEVLQNQRADYGQQIVATLSRQLMNEYGRNFEEKNLRRIIQFSKIFGLCNCRYAVATIKLVAFQIASSFKK